MREEREGESDKDTESSWGKRDREELALVFLFCEEKTYTFCFCFFFFRCVETPETFQANGDWKKKTLERPWNTCLDHLGGCPGFKEILDSSGLAGPARTPNECNLVWPNLAHQER